MRFHPSRLKSRLRELFRIAKGLASTRHPIRQKEAAPPTPRSIDSTLEPQPAEVGR